VRAAGKLIRARRRIAVGGSSRIRGYSVIRLAISLRSGCRGCRQVRNLVGLRWKWRSVVAVDRTEATLVLRKCLVF